MESSRDALERLSLNTEVPQKELEESKICLKSTSSTSEKFILGIYGSVHQQHANIVDNKKIGVNETTHLIERTSMLVDLVEQGDTI